MTVASSGRTLAPMAGIVHVSRNGSQQLVGAVGERAADPAAGQQLHHEYSDAAGRVEGLLSVAE